MGGCPAAATATASAATTEAVPGSTTAQVSGYQVDEPESESGHNESTSVSPPPPPFTASAPVTAHDPSQPAAPSPPADAVDATTDPAPPAVPQVPVSAARHEEADGPAAQLAGMFPDMDQETIEDVLAAKGGDADAAVVYLLELSGAGTSSPTRPSGPGSDWGSGGGGGGAAVDHRTVSSFFPCRASDAVQVVTDVCCAGTRSGGRSLCQATYGGRDTTSERVRPRRRRRPIGLFASQLYPETIVAAPGGARRKAAAGRRSGGGSGRPRRAATRRAGPYDGADENRCRVCVFSNLLVGVLG
jgi:hypothetical protein